MNQRRQTDFFLSPAVRAEKNRHKRQTEKETDRQLRDKERERRKKDKKRGEKPNGAIIASIDTCEPWHRFAKIALSVRKQSGEDAFS